MLEVHGGPHHVPDASRDASRNLAGDFNQSTLFDSPSDPLHFSHWLSKAEALGFVSLYHLNARCAHGEEPDKTFFLYHDVKKPHHLDYIFAKPELYERGFEFTVGDHRSLVEAQRSHAADIYVTAVRRGTAGSA
jgi:hypothetical protein